MSKKTNELGNDFKVAERGGTGEEIDMEGSTYIAPERALHKGADDAIVSNTDSVESRRKKAPMALTTSPTCSEGRRKARLGQLARKRNGRPKLLGWAS